MVEPVYDMKTSSSDGRATLTDRMGTPSSANSRGTKFSPSGTAKVTSSSATVASIPNRSRRALIAAWSSSVLICTRSVPTLAFRASGVSSTMIWPLSMIAIRSQYSASSM